MIVSNPFSGGSWTGEDIDNVRSGWWVLLISGLVSLVAGTIILSINWTVGDLAGFVGTVLIIRGFFTMLSVPVDGASRLWSAGLGLIEVFMGIAVCSWPGPTLLVVAAMVGSYMLFGGVVTLAGAIVGRATTPYWALTLTVGLVETLFSMWLLARPGLTLVAAVLAIGLWSMLYGVGQIALAFEIKHMSGRVVMVAQPQRARHVA